MAIARDGAAQAGTGGEGLPSYTYGVTVNGPNPCLLVAVVGAVNSDNISGATYGGAAMTLVDKQLCGNSSDRWHYVFIKKAASTGTNNLVVSASPSGSIYPVAQAYSGVLQTGTYDARAKGSTGGVTFLQIPLTTIANNCWVFCGCRNGGNTTTPGTGLASIGFDSTAADSGVAKSPAGTYNFRVNCTDSAQLGMILASFEPAPTGGSTVPVKAMHQFRQRTT